MSKPRSKLISTGSEFLKKLVFDEAPASGGEHRREPRQPVAGEVIVIVLDGGGQRQDSHRVFIRNLSRNGCGLWSRVRIEPGSVVEIVFMGAKDQPVHRRANIAHCRGQEHTGFALGVRFCDEAAARKSA